MITVIDMSVYLQVLRGSLLKPKHGYPARNAKHQPVLIYLNTCKIMKTTDM